MTDTVKLWLTSAGVRAIKTMAQTAIGTIGAFGASVAMSDVQWGIVASATILAGIVSLLTSIAGIPEVSNGDSLAKIQQSR